MITSQCVKKQEGREGVTDPSSLRRKPKRRQRSKSRSSDANVSAAPSCSSSSSRSSSSTEGTGSKSLEKDTRGTYCLAHMRLSFKYLRQIKIYRVDSTHYATVSMHSGTLSLFRFCNSHMPMYIYSSRYK